MKEFRTDRVLSRPSIDLPLFGMVLLLGGVGLSVLYSASYGYATRFFNDPTLFLSNQAIFMAIGLAACLLISAVKTETLRKGVKILLIFSLLAQLLPFLPFIGGEKNGAHRWIYLMGRSFQPSELLRPVLIVYLAHIFDKKNSEEKSQDILNGLLPPLLISSAAILLVFAQNDLSSAAILAIIALSMFWISGLPLRFFLAFLSIILPLGLLSVITSEFRLHRIITYLFPDYDARGMSYQMLSSLRAVRSGGAFGKGIGLGTQKLAGIPEVHADFVFSAFAEEVGFIGVLMFFAVWAWFILRCFRVSSRAPSLFPRYLAFGVSVSMALQVLLNLSVAAGFIPATGIPLPLFSAGGSSLIMTMIGIGLVLNVSKTAITHSEASL